MNRSLNRHITGAFALIAAISSPAPAVAQNIGVAAHAGTLGLGADVALSVAPKVSVRAGANVFPFDINFESSGIDYSLDWPSPRFMLVGDFYPAGGFRLTGGFLISSADYEVTGKLAEPVEFGDSTYAPEDVGTLTGSLDTRDVSPYLGIGFGGSASRRIGLFLDAGIAFHGRPEVSAVVDGPVNELPGFQEDLDTEVQEVQDDVDGFTVYPILSIGISFRLGDLRHRSPARPPPGKSGQRGWGRGGSSSNRSPVSGRGFSAGEEAERNCADA